MCFIFLPKFQITLFSVQGLDYHDNNWSFPGSGYVILTLSDAVPEAILGVRQCSFNGVARCFWGQSGSCTLICIIYFQWLSMSRAADSYLVFCRRHAVDLQLSCVAGVSHLAIQGRGQFEILHPGSGIICKITDLARV